MSSKDFFTPDCSRCAALCCVAPAFDAGEDFAIDKPARQACPNLDDDFRCRIHDELTARGFRGCVTFDCLGAGQRLVQDVFAGRDWRREPGIAAEMFDCFAIMRDMHNLLQLLESAARLPLDGHQRASLTSLQDRLGAERTWTAHELQTFALAETSQAVHEFLKSLQSLIAAEDRF